MAGESKQTYDLSFVFVPPSFGKKKELCTLNNMSRWYRFSKTKIKAEFKAMINEWYIPRNTGNPYKSAYVKYTILRKDGRKIDSDNLTIIYKWLQDLLVENDYLVDDDQVMVLLNPTVLNVNGNVETSVQVNIKFFERYEMTIQQLKINVDALQNELKNVGGENHVKAAGSRARILLGDIKKATPDLRRDIMELDKK